MSMTLRLLDLSADAQKCILSNIEHRAVRHMGLRFLGKLAADSRSAQQNAIAGLMARWAKPLLKAVE